MPEATKVEEPKPVVPAVVEAPASRNAETDKRVNEVLNEKRKRKHPVEARLAEMTKKVAAAEEKAAKDKAELEAKLAEQNEKNIAAELERRKAEAAASDKRPTKEEFPIEAEFTQKMAEWVVRQQDKIKPKPIEAKPAEVKPDPAIEAAIKQEFDAYQQSGADFTKRNPDFNDVLQKAFDRGLVIRPLAGRIIMRLKAPEVSYYLARPENEADTRRFMAMDDIAQAAELGRIHERLKANPQDFISRAGKPGVPLNGNAVTDVRPDEMTVEEYLRKRNQDIKAGIRRRAGR